MKKKYSALILTFSRCHRRNIIQFCETIEQKISWQLVGEFCIFDGSIFRIDIDTFYQKS
jgi:hypothetical protein